MKISWHLSTNSEQQFRTMQFLTLFLFFYIYINHVFSNVLPSELKTITLCDEMRIEREHTNQSKAAALGAVNIKCIVPSRRRQWSAARCLFSSSTRSYSWFLSQAQYFQILFLLIWCDVIRILLIDSRFVESLFSSCENFILSLWGKSKFEEGKTLMGFRTARLPWQGALSEFALMISWGRWYVKSFFILWDEIWLSWVPPIRSIGCRVAA